MRLPLSIALFFVFSVSFSAFGQSYFANGSASAIGNSCYQLTPASNWQLGSVWYKNQLDLNADFDLEFDLNFGNKDVGADGIVFVLQNKGTTALGQAGGGLGFEGFSPSLGIEFDTWQNIDQGDPGYDHIAILKNGSVNHNGANSIVNPISALSSGGNMEDGQNHLVRITWEAKVNLLEVWFDCTRRMSFKLDIKNSIFNGQNTVYWGFTAATGGENNTQVACLRDDIITSDSIWICSGESIKLNARESETNEYLWSPSTYLDDSTLQNPNCRALMTTEYQVEYTDRCGKKWSDTTLVIVEKKPDLSTLTDVELCKGEESILTVENTPGDVFWNGVLGTDTFILFNYEGSLEVKSKNDCGSDSITLNVTLEDCTCDMYFPNIITPNQDGLNDFFRPIDICTKLEDYQLSIYNRWGELLFETKAVYQSWDGTYNGVQVPDGVYFWIAHWSYSQNDQFVSINQNGAIQVLD